MKKILLAVLTIVLLTAGAYADQKKIKAGFVYVGPVGDAGWTYSHDQGRLEMEKLPFVEKSTYIESVPEGADATRIINGLAARGHNVIFTTSFGYMDPTLDVAKRFKNIQFFHCSGYKTAENVSSYFGRIYQARYLSGLVAGKMTKSNVIGYVAAFPIPEVIRGINAFTLGVRAVNPDAVVKVVWTHTWFDPGKEREAAESVLDAKADVIAMHQDTPAPLQAAEKRGAYAIGYNVDMQKFAPKAYLTSPVWNWAMLYEKVAKEVSAGTWKSQSIWWGMAEGLVDLAPMSDLVPADVKAVVEAEKVRVKNGTNKIFTGPIKDQNGKVVVAEGVTMSDAQLLSLDFFVEGVQGSPK
jgi:basic membrane protein A